MITRGAYSKLNIHRGHQAPLAGLDGRDSFYQTNYLSNITPQKANLNSGSWRVLESRLRGILEEETIRSVYVMTGPLYEKEMPSLPEADEDHKIPNGYWKIVAIKKIVRFKRGHSFTVKIRPILLRC
ncbi:DNA/RNA non-specific endonuclease [Fodinibius sp. Rm-B-1B1-1]|uniref:DNA/RNA non-specific endonuclease n=1 Tax=Fodinibius alkaliphilus TaxID=3140241 RepID=UPI00315AA141